MRLAGGNVGTSLRSICATAAGVLRSGAVQRILPVYRGAAIGCRYSHSYTQICSRIATLRQPLEVTQRPNVRMVNDHEEFHSTVYSLPERESAKAEDLVVSVFVSKQNTASLSVLECIDKLSQEFPENRFLIIDADQVPRAAYDADLQQFPAALLSFGGDIHRQLVQETNGYPDDWQGSLKWELPRPDSDTKAPVECVLPERFYKSVKDGILAFARSFHGKKIAGLTSRCGTHSYTHGIDTDNLNVKRIGWPTE